MGHRVPRKLILLKFKNIENSLKIRTIIVKHSVVNDSYNFTIFPKELKVYYKLLHTVK